MKYISETRVNVPDDNYDALWSGYTLDILSNSTHKPMCTVKTTVGVRGINCPVRVNIMDGNISRI